MKNNNLDDEAIVFYCKDCEEIVDADKCGKRYVYKCKKCRTKNVAFGTKKSISNYFRIQDDKAFEPEEREKSEKK
ncbi:hypothetical protein GF354_01365 [Candidatus Peregrinibacteria bacterium]|nr:hypothetical protein [Candidatus Peregrinibacteria bacterium]